VLLAPWAAPACVAPKVTVVCKAPRVTLGSRVLRVTRVTLGSVVLPGLLALLGLLELRANLDSVGPSAPLAVVVSKVRRVHLGSWDLEAPRATEEIVVCVVLRVSVVRKATLAPVVPVETRENKERVA